MANPPAGWYDDPAGNPATERFWDGAQWTEQTRPTGAPPPPPPPAPVPAQPSTPTPPNPVSDPGAAPSSAGLPPAPSAVSGSVIAGPGPDQPTAAPGPEAGSVPPAPVPPGPVSPGPAPPGPSPMSDPGPAPASMPGAGLGIGGIHTDLLTDSRYAETGSGQRVANQNAKLLKVVLGEDVLARQGSMVAFQGAIDFDHEGSGAGKFLKKAMTGEGLPLMRCTGQGELFLADNANQIHIIHLDGAGLTINGHNVLAFEPSLSWDIERVKGVGIAAGGLFNTKLEGHGWVAITTDGDPVVLRTDQPTFADADAAVAWSSSLTTTLNRTLKAKALVGRGSGEAAQLAFSGQGIVIIQPSEGGSVPPHTH
ncbi:MAG: DUF2510 domain-containing protein [Actinomycetia bacterium]|nr:DUF2510 domain-containing protein [Actinomycetes bacterium]